ncbi:MAG: AAA family ATPase, partial [Planctomycetota bacterium]
MPSPDRSSPLSGSTASGARTLPWRSGSYCPPPLASRAFPGLDTGTAPQTNLEAPATSFVGREIDIEALDGFLFGPTAATLVTITGGPGIGKTRLAREFALSRIDRFAGGCWFIDLGEVTDLAGIAHAVSRALGAPLSPRLDPAEAVADILECREPLLLVLDNFEQVVAAAEETIGLWRSRAPHLRCLVTSRVRLHLAGEQSCELTPLSVPPARGDRPVMPDQLSSYDSVRLFVDRARLVRRDFRIEASNAAAIAELCAAVDGLPLAIELATARLSILSPRQIADRLTEKFEILSTTEKGRHPRHQTLLAAIEWSFELLTGAEQQAFLQACTFRGGFSLEAALAVIDLSAIDGAPPAIDVVQSLCEKSLIHSFETPHEMRFGLYLGDASAMRDYGNSGPRNFLPGKEEWKKRKRDGHAAKA